MKATFTLRLLVVITLVLAYVGMALYFHLVLETGVVYVHFAYLAVVLATIWWGRRGLVVPVGMVGFIVLWRALGISVGPLWNDAARIVFVLTVGVVVALLGEKVRQGTRALKESEASYRAFFENALAGILLYRDGHILLANQRCGEMLGYPPDQLRGIPVNQLLNDPTISPAREIAAKLETGDVSDYHRECQLIQQDGTPIWVDLASSMVDYEGKPAVQVNVYDITGRKEAEKKEVELREFARQQEEQLVHSTRLAELGEMAASVAHEINQPLTGIRNFAKNAVYMLENQVGEPEELLSNLHQISKQVDRASNIIRRMRQLTRKEEREVEPLDINALVKESLEFLAPQLKLSGVEVILETDSSIPRTLGHRIRLEQVLLNLLTNARQAMENSDRRHLEVRTRFEEGTACPIALDISDTGVGFEQDKAELLFQPFYTTKKAGHGTGLGLTISYGIVKDHGGTIEAKGSPNQGATFTVRLPVYKEITRPVGAEGT